MKSTWMLASALAIFALMATACEEQEKKAEERGKVPQEILNKAKDAKQKVKNAVKAMEEGLNNAGNELESE